MLDCTKNKNSFKNVLGTLAPGAISARQHHVGCLRVKPGAMVLALLPLLGGRSNGAHLGQISHREGQGGY